MNDSKIPVRYSKSLFEVALERGNLDRIYHDMRILRALFSMKEIREVMDNPVITPAKRREITGALLIEKNLDDLTMKFIDLVFSEGREKYLPSMCRDFIDLTRKYRRISEVTITTTSSLNEENRNAVKTFIQSKMNSVVELVEKTDSELLGGFILQVDDTYIDASVRSRINRFRKEFGGKI